MEYIDTEVQVNSLEQYITDWVYYSSRDIIDYG